MVITYLIGNGFDLNLGLHTSYEHFISKYIDCDTKNARVKVFKESIRKDLDGDNIKLWKDAELAFGAKTKDFCGEANPGEQYNTCEVNFCNSLAEYLREEQSRFNPEYYEGNQTLLKNTADNLTNVASGLKKAPKNEVKSYIQELPDEIQLNFMVFNYTFTTDYLLEKVKPFLGQRFYKHTTYSNVIKNILHVHGTIDGNMVFGVDNKSQLAAPEIFDGDQIDLNAILKEETNEANEENLEQDSIQLLESSDLIYIYGMSLGETDKRWWERIIKLMLKKSELRLIIALHDVPTNNVINTAFFRRREEITNDFLSYADDLTDEEQISVSSRIYFDVTNKFEQLKDIVPSRVTEAYIERNKKTMN